MRWMWVSYVCVVDVLCVCVDVCVCVVWCQEEVKEKEEQTEKGGCVRLSISLSANNDREEGGRCCHTPSLHQQQHHINEHSPCTM